MQRILGIIAFVFALSPGLLGASSVEGDWAATLQAGPQKLRLALHITRADSGALTATLDSLDQGAKGLEIDSVALTGDRLDFKMNRLRASYSGTVSEDGQSMAGTWMQGPNSMPLRFERVPAGAPPPLPAGVFDDPALEPLLGVWSGLLVVGANHYRVVVRVTKDAEGYLVMLESPDQGSKLPVTTIDLEAGEVRFAAAGNGGSYEGAMHESGARIRGTWSQAGGNWPLNLERSGKVPEARRPQNPAKPYPYKALEVAFPGGGNRVTLAGTLTVPKAGAPFPAAVLISGSGAQDRDETVMGHKPFLVLADHLTRHGIAVLRYDDRGTARSTGDFATATSADFAADAEAAFNFLNEREEVASGRTGLIGHSEGALIAPMVANRVEAVAWVVLLGCPGMRGDQIILSQSGKALEMAGVPRGGIKEREAVMDRLLTAVRTGQSAESVRALFDQAAPGVLAPPNAPPELRRIAIDNMTSPWMRWFLQHDPLPDISGLRVPALALYGEKDIQVIPELNAPPVRRSLKATGVAGSRVEILESLNHLFQTCETGSVSEYGAIEQTFAPAALTAIQTWISERVS